MKPTDLLKPGERLDDLQRGGRYFTGGPFFDTLHILQDPALFCFGMDAVLLSAYVQMKKARRGLDLGAGNGILPLLLADRTDCPSLTGLEIWPASVDLARRSVALNGLEGRITIIEGDIREAGRLFSPASFDFITCNPPYRALGAGKVSGTGAAGRIGGANAAGQAGGLGGANMPGQAGGAGGANMPGKEGGPGGANMPGKAGGAGGANMPGKAGGIGEICGSIGEKPEDVARAIARHEILCSFEDVARAAATLLRPGGHFYLIHRPLRLPGILTALCAHRLEPKRMRLVHPRIGRPPNMVLIDSVRGASPELRIEPPLIVYGEDGQYTPELLQIYTQGNK